MLPPAPSVPITGVGRLRKIALVGSAPTIDFAPWHDPTWEIWSHAICAGRCVRVDRIFEMHDAVVWREHKKPQWPNYLQWLQRNHTPIYMLEKHSDIPASVRYPRERIFAECVTMVGKEHFGNQADFMIALALSEGVTHLGLFGVHYVDMVKDGERLDQLLSFKFWLGVACGKGVQLVVPRGNPVFDVPREIYGFESHNSSEKYRKKLEDQKQIQKSIGTGSHQVVEKLSPLTSTHVLAPLPWNDHLGTAPMPENWNQFSKDT